MGKALTLLYLIACLGCGYVPLRAGQAYGAEKILVMPPREAEPTGIAGPYVEELRRRLAAEGFTLAPNAPAADATLRSEVTDSSTVPLAAAAGAQLTAFTVRVRMTAELRTPNGETLWQARFTESEEFFPEGNTAEALLATEANRRRALYRLTERLAAEVVRSLQRASL